MILFYVFLIIKIYLKFLLLVISKIVRNLEKEKYFFSHKEQTIEQFKLRLKIILLKVFFFYLKLADLDQRKENNCGKNRIPQRKLFKTL